MVSPREPARSEGPEGAISVQTIKITYALSRARFRYP